MCVYKISCDNCEASYVDQTKRKSSTRIREHISDINKKRILHLSSDYRINFRWNEMKILDSESSYNKRLISEMILIKRQKQNLNKQNDTESLSEPYLQITQSLSPS